MAFLKTTLQALSITAVAIALDLLTGQRTNMGELAFMVGLLALYRINQTAEKR